MLDYFRYARLVKTQKHRFKKRKPYKGVPVYVLKCSSLQAEMIDEGCVGFIAYGPIIIIRSERVCTPALLRHEYEHAWQEKEEGTFLFGLKYYWNHLFVGYHDNPYEVAARAAEEE